MSRFSSCTVRALFREILGRHNRTGSQHVWCEISEKQMKKGEEKKLRGKSGEQSKGYDN